MQGFLGLQLDQFGRNCPRTGIKSAWYWYKDGQIDQWNKIESLEMESEETHLFVIFYLQFYRKQNSQNLTLNH